MLFQKSRLFLLVIHLTEYLSMRSFESFKNTHEIFKMFLIKSDRYKTNANPKINILMSENVRQRRLKHQNIPEKNLYW